MSQIQKLTRIALLVALATILHTLETIYLHPIFPWTRIGLANIITLIAIILFGTKIGIEVSVLRTILSNLLRGTLFSPTFILGLSGGIASAIVMGIVYKIGRKLFSFIGISIIGAVVNNLTQIIVVYFLIKHIGCFYLLPLFLLSSLITGFFNGVVVIYLDKHLKFSGG